MLDTRKSTGVCEGLDVSTWQCHAPGWPATPASHRVIAEQGNLRSDNLTEFFATAAHLNPLWINKPWVENGFSLPGPSFPLSLCAFQMAQGNKWPSLVLYLTILPQQAWATEFFAGYDEAGHGYLLASVLDRTYLQNFKHFVCGVNDQTEQCLPQAFCSPSLF